MNWSHGYNTSMGYTYGFYRELAPHWLNFGALLHGYHVPDATRPFRYLELGCGQGFGLCILATSYPQAQFVGVDFNPQHVAHARELAHAAGLHNVRFEEADFSLLAEHWPADYGLFDYVVLHGIYSWVPAQVRQSIVQDLAHATQPGALVYVSYNALPGWTSAIPLQHLLRQLQIGQSARSSTQIIQQGRDLMERLLKAGAAVGQALPPLRSRLESLKSHDPAYLVQEYLHESWHTLWFSQVAEELSAAKLRYVGTATLPENYLPNLLNDELAQTVRSVDDPTLQCELIDLAINQSFRRDLYCRGPRSARTSAEQLARFTLHLGQKPVPSGSLEINTSFSTLTINAHIVDSVFSALGDKPLTIAEMAALPVFQGPSLHQPLQVATLLLHAGYVLLGGMTTDAAQVAAFNQIISQRVAEEWIPYGCLAVQHSPTAIGASDTDMLFHHLLGPTEKRKTPEAEVLAGQLLALLGRCGRTLLNNGSPIEKGSEQRKQAQQLAQTFLHDTLPVWQRLGVFST